MLAHYVETIRLNNANTYHAILRTLLYSYFRIEPRTFRNKNQEARLFLGLQLVNNPSKLIHLWYGFFQSPFYLTRPPSDSKTILKRDHLRLLQGKSFLEILKTILHVVVKVFIALQQVQNQTVA